jgi:CTP-dependent riboflavin kinase
VSEGDPIRYRSDDEDSARWEGFAFRHGDIVISTRSKSGTTWMQMICALLIFQTAELPEPLGRLSPWLDWTGTPRHEIFSRLAAQDHRRLIKTHTPLDGIPVDRRATYIVVARHPLDMAVSLYHQGDNIDRERLRRLTGRPRPVAPPPPRPPLHQWLVDWIDEDAGPTEHLDSLPGVLGHVSGAWRRRQEPNIVLVHYDDLAGDLEGQMRGLAALLGITVPEATWPGLVAAARFEEMRAAAVRVAPDPADILKDRSLFFRRGTSGAGREVLSPAELAHYRARVEEMAPADVVAWLHREPVGHLRGTVTGGRGDLAHWMVEYADQYERVNGVRLFPGSLNVVMASEYRLPDERLRLDPADYGGRVGMNLVPCRIADIAGFIVPTDQNEAGTGDHGRQVIEVVAAVNLRETLGLVDGDEVEIVVGD